jgi:hypothetical protein
MTAFVPGRRRAILQVALVLRNIFQDNVCEIIPFRLVMPAVLLRVREFELEI